MICRTAGCMLPMHRGFRICFDCMRGLTPEVKRKQMEELQAKADALKKELEESEPAVNLLTEEQALLHNMAIQGEEE